jgi:UDP-N-acetylglucosamine acyltransferase
MTTYHPSSFIDPTAEIAEDVHIGPSCFIGPNVSIDSGTILSNHVSIQCNTTIGKNNKLYPFSVLGGDPQDKKYADEITTLEIGDRNEIREHVTIHRGTNNGGGKTIVGSDNLLMVASHVAHDCILGNNLVIANQVMLAGHIIVEDCATIGGGAGINQFTRIGRTSYVGGLTRITRDVPPYMIVEGTPAQVRAVNTVGMTRLKYPEVQIEVMKIAFKMLFKENGGALSEKMSQLLEEFGEHNPVQCLCEAIQASASGKHGRSNEKIKTH